MTNIKTVDINRYKLKEYKKRSFLYRHSRSGKTVLTFKPQVRTTYYLIDRFNSGKQTKISGAVFRALVKIGIQTAHANS